MEDQVDGQGRRLRLPYEAPLHRRAAREPAHLLAQGYVRVRVRANPHPNPHQVSQEELGAALASQERSKQAVKDETVWVASNVNRQDDALAPATQALCRYSASSYLPS